MRSGKPWANWSGSASSCAGAMSGAAVRSYAREEVLQIYQVREFLQRQAALMIALPAPRRWSGNWRG